MRYSPLINQLQGIQCRLPLSPGLLAETLSSPDTLQNRAWSRSGTQKERARANAFGEESCFPSIPTPLIEQCHPERSEGSAVVFRPLRRRRMKSACQTQGMREKSTRKQPRILRCCVPRNDSAKSMVRKAPSEWKLVCPEEIARAACKILLSALPIVSRLRRILFSRHSNQPRARVCTHAPRSTGLLTTDHANGAKTMQMGQRPSISGSYPSDNFSALCEIAKTRYSESAVSVWMGRSI